MASGTVLGLYRWPVKSLGGEPVDALRIDRRGAGGDRAHALVVTHKGEQVPLTVRQAPRMLGWHASYDGVPGETLTSDDAPLPIVTGPDGRAFRWDDPALEAAMGDDLGRPVALRRDLALMPDLQDSLLVTVEATLRAVGRELGTTLDLRRFRPNVHVALDAEAFAEEGWEGRRLRVGEAELELLHPCERCAIPTRDPDTFEKWPELLKHLAAHHDQLFGINARAHAAATIRVGDRVEVV